MLDTSKMIRIQDLPNSGLEDAAELEEMAREATEFLRSHHWCLSIKEGFLDRGWAGILAVFYYEIAPAGSADSSVWVITGDLPPAYLDIQTCPNGAAAIDGYVGAMQEWVEHVRRGESVDGLIPVRRRNSLAPVTPSLEYADMLAKRLDFIDKRILPQFEAELRE
jgi:hypothetical protein